ncbi:MAG: zinc ribbon domain-containing protein [Bacteroidia bacterium]|nr:zinc ribbon domain-containing protein [Bacteroidia bacterium]
MNCPSCQAPLPPQSNYCNVCGKPLDAAFPDQIDKEKKRYRKFVLFVSFFLIGQMFLYWIIDVAEYLSGHQLSLGFIIRPVSYLITICFYTIPLLSAFVFPKKSGIRVLLIIIGSVCLAIRIGLYIKQFFFEPAFNHFQF